MSSYTQPQPLRTHGPVPNTGKVYLLDMKQADVNGDGISDQVFLYGNKPEGEAGLFAEQITLVIQTGHFNHRTTVALQNNAGYNARLFLGDFSKDRIADIMVTIDAGGSGGYISAYIYSFRNNVLQELFDVEKYNRTFKFHVNYEDYYKVSVGSAPLDVLFILDISHKGADYLSQYYYADGKLKNPTQGEVLALGALYPVVTDSKGTTFDLIAMQRIIGTINADTLGYVENMLRWGGTAFTSYRLSVAIPPMKLSALY